MLTTLCNKTAKNYKNKRLQFCFFVKAAALKQQTSKFYPQILSIEASFYPRGASNARVIAVIVCPCVCLSLCVSHAGIVSKRLNVGSRKQHHVIARGI